MIQHFADEREKYIEYRETPIRKAKFWSNNAHGGLHDYSKTKTKYKDPIGDLVKAHKLYEIKKSQEKPVAEE